MENNKTIVIDNGTGFIKAGFHDQDAPSSVFPAVVGHQKFPNPDARPILIGQEAVNMRGLYDLHFPVEHGIIDNHEEMKMIWKHTLEDQLRVDERNLNQPVHLTEAPLNPQKNREDMCEYFFREVGASHFYVSIQAVLALYGEGRTTGLVYDSGDGVTHTVPVAEGFQMKHGIVRSNLAGRDITRHLFNELRMECPQIGDIGAGGAALDLVRDIKERCCYVSQNYETEMQEFQEDQARPEAQRVRYTAFQLPDGGTISFGRSQITAPEAFFKPGLMGAAAQPVHEMIRDSINRCDINVRRRLWENIYLSGGSTMFPNIDVRLTSELNNFKPAAVNMRVYASNRRRYLVWIGAAAYSQLGNFLKSCVTKAEYEEEGATVLHRKCI